MTPASTIVMSMNKQGDMVWHQICFIWKPCLHDELRARATLTVAGTSGLRKRYAQAHVVLERDPYMMTAKNECDWFITVTVDA